MPNKNLTDAEIIKDLEVYSDGISGMHEDFDPGLQETCVNAIDFANPSEFLEYKKWYCRCNHTQCSVSKMLITKYNNILNS